MNAPPCLCKSLLCNFHTRTMRRISWGNIANPPKQAAALSCIRNNSLMLVEISANLVMDGGSEWQIRLAGWPTKEWKRKREGGGFLSRFLFRCSLGIVGLSPSRPTHATHSQESDGRAGRGSGVNSFLSITSRPLSLDDCVFGEEA